MTQFFADSASERLEQALKKGSVDHEYKSDQKTP